MTYSVVNTKTKELFSENGSVARFGTFHQARIHRITLNDQSKVRHGHGGCAHGWTERTLDWQVIESPVQSAIRATMVNIDIEGEYFTSRRQEMAYYVSGEIKPITRAPRTNTKAARQRAAFDRAEFSRQIKNTPVRVRRRKSS